MSQDFLSLFGWLPLAAAVGLACIMGLLTVNALFVVWYERKVSGRIQNRLGPTEMGPAGMLQTVVDMVKLISKQIIVPKNVDRPLYLAAPVVIFAPVVVSVALFPFSESWAVTDVNISLVLVFAFAGLSIIGIFMAGWGSNNKYALLGAMRSVAQNVSYEIPLILSTLSIVLMTRSMSLSEIAAAQSPLWFVLFQPVAAVIYLISATAETNRAPFDIPEAESELVAGFHTEYSGMGFAMFMFAEYSSLLVVSMVATVLFLGGWSGPLLPGPVWFLLKTYLVMTVVIWFRWTFPRLRFDQLMTFAWAVLIPLSILNLLVTGLVLKLL